MSVDPEEFERVLATLIRLVDRRSSLPRERHREQVPADLASSPPIAAGLDSDASPPAQWTVVEESLRVAAEQIRNDDWRAAALESLALTASAAGKLLGERDIAAAANFATIPVSGRSATSRSESWYRGRPGKSLTPRHRSAALVAAALCGAGDPERYVDDIYLPSLAARPRLSPSSQAEPGPDRVAQPYARRPGVIRDPIHGYVPFTSLEAALLEEPIVQRLRYVSQMAASRHVFPSATTSRFEHSIGAMHVASRLFAGAIANTQATFRDQQVIAGACELAGSDYKWREGPTSAEEARWDHDERALRTSGIACPPYGEARVRVGLMIVDQALRIATLLHDLGHMPFSHDMELVLADLMRNGAAAARWPAIEVVARDGPAFLHEAIGQRIGQYLLQRSFRGRNPTVPLANDLRPLADRALDLAITIVAGPGTTTPSTDSERCRAWLYTLLNGEIDADRCDYILRDGRSHSIPGVSFDLDRIVRSVVVVESGDDAMWALAVQGGGVGAFEEMLVARWRLYVWGIYHHKAQAIALALRSSILHLAEQDRGNEMALFVDLIDDLLAAPQSPRDHPPPPRPPRRRQSLSDAARGYESWDDIRIAEMFRHYVASKQDSAAADMRTFIHRRGPGYQSLWKRGTDLSREEITRMNAVVADPDELERWRHAAIEHDVHLVPLAFKAYAELRSGESEMQVLVGGTPEPVSLRSSLLTALRDAWRTREPHVYAFVRRENWTDQHTRDILRRTIVDAL